ncbi:MAG: hypothetical protein ACYSUY_07450 [Planctomycetota bacterium]|jgi:hypothetical protein
MAKRKYTNEATKMMKLPRWYREGFLMKMDQRTKITKAIQEAYGEVMDDLGGYEAVSGIKRTLVERFSFCKFMIIDVEQKILTTDPKKRGKLIGRWMRLNQTLKNLGVALGLERQRKPAISLKAYVKDKKKKNG